MFSNNWLLHPIWEKNKKEKEERNWCIWESKHKAKQRRLWKGLIKTKSLPTSKMEKCTSHCIHCSTNNCDLVHRFNRLLIAPNSILYLIGEQKLAKFVKYTADITHFISCLLNVRPAQLASSLYGQNTFSWPQHS